MNIDERVHRIHGLDLEPIKFKLVNGDGEPGWTVAEVDRVEVEYKKFLVLNLKNRASQRVQSVVPTKEVDKFWHTHILDTMKYEADCQLCLGFFLHHFPYLGLRGPEDALVLKNRFRESTEYYREEFGMQSAPTLSGICSQCDTSDCTPEPSCSGEPDPVIHSRPILARA